MIELASTSMETALLSCDKVTYIKSAFESIVKHVNDLLNVPKCGHGTNSNLLDDTDRIRDVSPTRLMEQVIFLAHKVFHVLWIIFGEFFYCDYICFFFVFPFKAQYQWLLQIKIINFAYLVSDANNLKKNTKLFYWDLV